MTEGEWPEKGRGGSMCVCVGRVGGVGDGNQVTMITTCLPRQRAFHTAHAYAIPYLSTVTM